MRASLVIGIRRLSVSALSAAHHRARHGVEPDYRPAAAEADEIARTKDPDDMLRWMTDADRLPVRRWRRRSTCSRTCSRCSASWGS